MTNALFNDNRLKLGVFGLNVSNGCAATTAEGHLELTWQNNLDIAVMADRAGIEALVPVARWKGFGGKTNFNGTCFETYTWAAGLAAATRQVAVFSTSHVPTVHPIVAAKQATTIDHISNGRFALNVVCGVPPLPVRSRRGQPSIRVRSISLLMRPRWVSMGRG